MSKKAIFILNPKASYGQGLVLWRRHQEELISLYPGIEFKPSEFSRHAEELTRQSIAEGAEIIIVAGGDGTLNEVINGVMTSEHPAEVKIGILPVGTGCDFIKSVGIPRDWEKGMDILKKGAIKICDVGKVIFLNQKRKKEARYFINIASFGCSGRVVETANRAPKWLGGFTVYTYAIVSSFLQFKAVPVRLKFNGRKSRQYVIQNVFVSNGQYSGGGKRWAPKAKLDDGLFDVVVCGDIPKTLMMMHLKSLMDGTFDRQKGVNLERVTTLVAQSRQKVLLELDGELVGQLPASFSIRKQAVRLFCPLA